MEQRFRNATATEHVAILAQEKKRMIMRLIEAAFFLAFVYVPVGVMFGGKLKFVLSAAFIRAFIPLIILFVVMGYFGFLGIHSYLSVKKRAYQISEATILSKHSSVRRSFLRGYIIVSAGAERYSVSLDVTQFLCCSEGQTVMLIRKETILPLERDCMIMDK